MTLKITLASTSHIRRHLLTSANINFTACDSGFDEGPLKASLIEKKTPPSEIAIALAAGKARALALTTEGLVLGCDQVLAYGDRLLSKPKTIDHAREQLKLLRGGDHMLLSAAVIFEGDTEVWFYVGQVTLTMRNVSDAYLDGYLDRNWPSIQSSVGAYKLEEEGVRLFSRIEGDYFTVLGMPLVEILDYLGQRGIIET